MLCLLLCCVMAWLQQRLDVGLIPEQRFVTTMGFLVISNEFVLVAYVFASTLALVQIAHEDAQA